jgi:hypothetical protein
LPAVRHVRACLAIGVVLWASPARAVDVGDVGGQPVQLDVTETSIVEKHFAVRTPPNQPSGPGLDAIEDSEWGGWINRLDTRLRWGHWDLGLRLDSAVYAFRPVDYTGRYPSDKTQIVLDNESRFKNSIYPAKLWATYSAPGVEVTAGDAYVQFGRGLTLSMRKVDELGIDTTVRGGKVQITRDPFSLTAVAGFANPSRVDEATGRALWVTSDLQPGDTPTPVYGSDRVVGIDLQAGRGLPLTLSTHFARFTRCAPYHFDNGNFATSFGSDSGTAIFGTCDAGDTDVWLNQSLNLVPLGIRAHDITMVGQSIEVPSLWGHGTFYVEAAVQQRQDDQEEPTNRNGNALYAALTYDIGKTSSTFELKSYRNFYTVTASVGPAAPEFALVAYTFVPPAESFNMLDAEGTGNFNACVEGGRFREDVNLRPDLLVYGQGVFAYSLTEQPGGLCDQSGRTVVSTGLSPASLQDVVWDGVTGFEYSFDDRLSHVFSSAGARDDRLKDGSLQYGEGHVEYSIAKYLGGPWSLELQGRYRHRWEQDFNVDLPTHTQHWWDEDENYVSLRMAPKWVFTTGFEYTTLIGQPRTYVNGAVLYKFTSASNLRVFVGQQRAAFRCASGMCRFFPAFEGARAELTLRF